MCTAFFTGSKHKIFLIMQLHVSANKLGFSFNLYFNSKSKFDSNLQSDELIQFKGVCACAEVHQVSE